MPATMPRISKEYLRVPATSSNVLDAQAVVIAVQIRPTGQAEPSLPTDWQTAEWVGPVGTTRNCRTLIGPLPPGNYDVWVKVTDAPEEPARCRPLALTIT